MFLSLSQKLSLNRIHQVRAIPSSGDCKDSLELHLPMGEIVETTGLTPNRVSKWFDYSGQSRHFIQETTDNMPIFSGTSVYFDGDNRFMTQIGSTTAIQLGTFTIGMVLSAAQSDMTNIVTIADSTTSNDFIRITSEDQIDIKADGQTRTVTPDNPLPDETPFSLILTRDASHVLKVYINNVLQTDTETFTAGKTLDIDTIGCRNNQINDYIGSIGEIVIYSCESASLLSDMQEHLTVIRNNMISEA